MQHGAIAARERERSCGLRDRGIHGFADGGVVTFLRFHAVFGIMGNEKENWIKDCLFLLWWIACILH